MGHHRQIPHGKGLERVVVRGFDSIREALCHRAGIFLAVRSGEAVKHLIPGGIAGIAFVLPRSYMDAPLIIGHDSRGGGPDDAEGHLAHGESKQQ